MAMDGGKFDLFSMLTTRMAWLGRRQQVLAQNVANADTPGYKPMDLKPLDFGRLAADAARRVEVRVTDAAHLAGTRPSPVFGAERQDITEMTPTGNAVVLEEQLMKVSETAMTYRLMTNLYRKHVNMIRTALGRGA